LLDGLSGSLGAVISFANVSAEGLLFHPNMLAPGIFQPLLHPALDRLAAITSGETHLIVRELPNFMASILR